MGNNRTIGLALIVIGVVALIVSLAADAIGVGAAIGAFGYKQIIGSVAVVVIAAVGYFYYSKK